MNKSIICVVGNIQDAEGILIQAGLVFRTIMLHLRMFNWDRALELAAGKPRYLPIILAYRRKFLGGLGRQENNKNYFKYKDEAIFIDLWFQNLFIVIV